MREMPGAETVDLLVVEDDPNLRGMLVEALSVPGRRVAAAGSGSEARSCLAGNAAPAVVILDLGLPDEPGTDLIPEFKSREPACVVIILTGTVEESTVVEAMRLGAMDYITKPFGLESLTRLVGRSVRKYHEDRRTMDDGGKTEGDGVKPSGFLVGRSPAMVELFKMIGRLASSDVPVLIRGASGSGKELAARALHKYSGYSGGEFVAVDCAGIPATLLESELFGHERGAFTDAREAKPGRFETADGGTLFLDEIGNIPLEVQSKLLRTLQDKRTQRLGSNRAIPWKARVVCASNTDLRKMVSEGRFREDLLFRIAGAELVIPPLRDRKEDIPLLTAHFLRRHGNGRGDGQRFSKEAMQALERYSWPGNVRELEHAVERAVAVASGPVIGMEDLPDELRGVAMVAGADAAPLPGTPEGVLAMDEMKRRYAREALRLCGGNRKEAARRLDIHVKTLNSLVDDPPKVTG